MAKTMEIKVIQGYFYNSWEDVTWYERSEYPQIKSDLNEYRKSGYGSYRVITRRVPING